MLRALALVISLVLPATAFAGTINSLTPATFPLADPGCPVSSTENLWMTQGSGDLRVTPLQLGYIYQGTTAPSCPYRYEQWWNTSTSPAQLEVYDGAQWQITGALDYINHAWTIPNPVLSGTVTGTYTLGGTPTIASAIFSGTATGTYTLAGTVNITSPRIETPTLISPIFTGTASGGDTIPLSMLAHITSHTILGYQGLGTGNVSNSYQASGSGNTLASTSGSFLAGDILVSGDTAGTVSDAGSSGSTIYFRSTNTGAANQLQILNNSTTAGTLSVLTLATGSLNSQGQLILSDTGVTATRKLQLVTASGIGGGIQIDASPGGSTAVLALTGGNASDGITLNGTPEVLYSFSNNAATTSLRVLNANNAANTASVLTAQTGTGGATASFEMVDGASPTGKIVAGAGALGGFTISTSTGPITLSPVSNTVPQVNITDTNAGAETRLQVLNNSSSASTTATVLAATGTSNSFTEIQTIDGATPTGKLVTGGGVSGGLVLNSQTGSVTIQPASSVAVVAPQMIVSFNEAGGDGRMNVINNSTSGSTTSAIDVSTGTVNSYLRGLVAETGHIATISTGAGVTDGLNVDSTLGGASSVLTLKSGGDLQLTPAAASVVSITTAGSFTAVVANCGTIAGSTGCWKIKDNAGATRYVPLF